MVKYKSVANDIRGRIFNGEFTSNVPMPVEKDLCAHYHVSKDTMKKALSLLVNEGLIYRQSGKGTYVREHGENIKQKYTDNSLAGYSGQRQYGENNIKTNVTYLEVVTPPVNVATAMQIKHDQFVFHFERIRQLNGVSEVIEESYVSIEILPKLTKSILEGSLFSYIEDELNLKIKSANKVIHVGKCTKREAEILGVLENDPLPYTLETLYLSTGEVFEYTVAKYNYQKFNFVTTITK